MIFDFAYDIGDKLGWRAAALFFLAGLTALLEGLAIAALLPLLRMVGLGTTSSADADPISSGAQRLASAAGYELTIPVLVTAVILIVTIQVSAFLLTQYVSGRWQARYMSLWLNDQFDGVMGARWKLFETCTLSDAVNSLTNDLLNKTGNAFIHFMHLVAGICFVATYVALAMILDARLTLLLLAGGLILTLVLRPLSRHGERVGRQLVETDRNLTALIANYVSGIKVVKVFGLEREAARDFRLLSREREASYFHYIFDPGLGRAAIEFFGPFFMVAALILGTTYVAQDIVTIVVVLALFARLYPRVATMQQAGHSLRVLLPGFMEARALNARAREHREPEHARSPASHDAKQSEAVALRLEGLTAGYGETPVLRNADLSIKAGAFVVLTGPSGSGKTTLIDTILGLLQPVSGHILANGRELAATSLAGWRSGIGYVDQDSLLFHDSIAGNIRAGNANLDDGEIETAARMAAAHDFITALPDGYDHVIGARGKGLSGGERQRIAIARALARRPGLLLLDEATSGLDPITETAVLRSLKSLHGRTTILFATHRDQPQTIATHVFRIENGKIVEQKR